MNAKIRRQLKARKRRIEKRLDKTKLDGSSPMLGASNIKYEIADRTQAIAAGGIGMIHEMAQWLKLDQRINRNVNIFKIYLPYSESDHVLNIAYNLLAGGTCLDHLEYRRNDEAYLNALGAKRIPDPTTAGDFCRRFTWAHIIRLQEVFNETRTSVWKQQPRSFFDRAVIDADGTMVETTGECKRGIDINWKGQWGYHPLLISLANTGEPLYIVNRGGSRPSHERAAEYLDRAVALCRRAGFRKILLRGDTDFSQTEHLDRWDAEGVEFVFGLDAMPNLETIAAELPASAWKKLKRSPKYTVKTEPRSRPENHREQKVVERGFKNICLVDEEVAEFSYSPTKCRRDYRVVVVRKNLEIKEGQRTLFNEPRYFFYITNIRELPAEAIVFEANRRCNQENTIEQLKNDVHAFTAPLDNLVSNWAYMVIASLAWSLKIWSALLLPVHGRWKEPHSEEKQRLLRMDFSTYLNAWIRFPAQIVRGGRRLIYRILSWNPWQHAFFRLLDVFRRPLRC